MTTTRRPSRHRAALAAAVLAMGVAAPPQAAPVAVNGQAAVAAQPLGARQQAPAQSQAPTQAIAQVGAFLPTIMRRQLPRRREPVWLGKPRPRWWDA